MSRRTRKWLGEVCSIKECDREAHCRGVCLTHYQYMMQGRDLIPLQKIASTKPSKLCSVANCEFISYARGFCHSHYKSGQEFLNPDCRRCEVPGCDKAHAARGYCEVHYEIWRMNSRRFEMKVVCDGT